MFLDGVGGALLGLQTASLEAQSHGNPMKAIILRKQSPPVLAGLCQLDTDCHQLTGGNSTEKCLPKTGL